MQSVFVEGRENAVVVPRVFAERAITEKTFTCSFFAQERYEN